MADLRRFQSFRRWLVGGPVLTAIMGVASCAPNFLSDGAVDREFTEPQPATVDWASADQDIEPNNSMEDAVALQRSVGRILRLSGRVEPDNDVDVYSLPWVAPGDQLTISIRRTSVVFNPTVALFDRNGMLLRVQSWPWSSVLDEVRSMDVVISASEAGVFLCVGTRESSASDGGYLMEVALDSAVGSPLPKAQTVILNFDGGVLDESILDVDQVGAFDLSGVSPGLVGDTAMIRSLIAEEVRRRVERFDIEILTSADPPPAGEASTIFIGAAPPAAFGAARGVDVENNLPCDDGVVFLDAFDASSFGFVLRDEPLVTAIANVAAHEIGHLLGLNHVVDYTAIMDEASPAVVLLFEQQFKSAPLSPTVFPIGEQDAPALLYTTVGFASPQSGR